MNLFFNGLEIYGTHGEPKFSPWNSQMQITEQFAVIGATVLIGERTTREIRIESWIHNDYVDPTGQSDLLIFLSDLEAKFGTLGTLTETGSINRTTENVLFIGYEQQRGPIPSNEIGWFSIGTLIFLQLRP